MEVMEDSAMDHGKRAAESGAIGSEKRIKISEEPPACNDDVVDCKGPCDGGLFCAKCDCYPIPPPTSEDVEKKRAYCHACAKYVDHAFLECPLRFGFGAYRLLDDGSWQDILCCLCGDKVHPGSSCFPPPPPFAASADEESDYDCDDGVL